MQWNIGLSGDVLLWPVLCLLDQEEAQDIYIFHESNLYDTYFFVFLVFNRIGQLLERFAAMETDSEEKTTENEDSLG